METDLVVKEKRLHEMENIAQMNQELVLQKDTQIRELEVQRSRKTATDAAVSNIQIASLKDQLEKIMRELNQAKAEYRNNASSSGQQQHAIAYGDPSADGNIGSEGYGVDVGAGANGDEYGDDLYAEHKAEYRELLHQQQLRKQAAQHQQPPLRKGTSPLARSSDSALPSPKAPITPSPRAVADSQESFEKSVEQIELEQRCRRAEIRCQLLSEQIQSMPESLSVAQVRLLSLKLLLSLLLSHLSQSKLCFFR